MHYMELVNGVRHYKKSKYILEQVFTILKIPEENKPLVIEWLSHIILRIYKEIV